MNTPSYEDQIAALTAHRVALAAQGACERAARLAAARRQEEARFMAANRLATAFERFFQRQQQSAAPAPPTALCDTRATERQRERRDAA